MKNLSWKYFFLALTILLLLPSLSNPPKPNKKVLGIEQTSESTLNNELEKAIVTRIIDGDTIEVNGKYKLRYIGIDTPEITGEDECYAKEATDFNTSLVMGKEVGMEKDVSETDRYGRLLRYVYLNGRMINEQLVSDGYATVSTFPPDVKYKDVLLNAEEVARNDKKGLWGKSCIKN